MINSILQYKQDIVTVWPLQVIFFIISINPLENGQLYAMGLNTKYQLGFDDSETRYYPTLISNDSEGNQLPNITKIDCTYFATFALTEQGKIYCWGSGYLGMSNKAK